MGVSTYTAERVQKAKAELDEARERLSRAQSQFLDAERRHRDALNAWEREFFERAEKRKAG
jgi:outer membrane protein TolC